MGLGGLPINGPAPPAQNRAHPYRSAGRSRLSRGHGLLHRAHERRLRTGHPVPEPARSLVPGEVVEALKPRAPELRKQTLELAGERLKSAGV